MRHFFIITVFLSIPLCFNQNKIDYEQNRKLILEAYEKNKEFIVVLQNGDKYRVSEVISITDDTYQFNILQDRLSGNIFYKNNISKRSDYNYGNNSKMVINIKAEDILMIESITYEEMPHLQEEIK